MGETLRAALYDALGRRWERKHGKDVRGKFLAAAKGRVLEIGVGTGGNLSHYPDGLTELVVTDPSAAMLRRAGHQAHELERPVTAVRARAESLPFDDMSFDTVVSTMVLCTVDDQATALREIRRVLRPGGELIFGEHVRSNDPGVEKWQDRLEGVWGFVTDGCHPNRPTLAAIEASGLDLVEVERGELPAVPTLVRPYVAGRAVSRAPNDAGSVD